MGGLVSCRKETSVAARASDPTKVEGERTTISTIKETEDSVGTSTINKADDTSHTIKAEMQDYLPISSEETHITSDVYGTRVNNNPVWASSPAPSKDRRRSRSTRFIPGISKFTQPEEEQQQGGSSSSVPKDEDTVESASQVGDSSFVPDDQDIAGKSSPTGTII
ncbi:unnamed protein product [Urochloa humidicola]